MIPMPGDTLDIALDILKAHPDWYLFPIRRLEKTPPLFKDELETNNSNDPKVIRKWHAARLGCNWGIALKKSKLVVVDVDTKFDPKLQRQKQGQATLDNLELERGPLPDTLTIRTPSGGYHYYFSEANGVEHRMAVNGFGEDVDSTNYVLVPGCWLSNGKQYEIIKNEPVAPTPEWFSEYLGDKPETAPVEQTPEIDLDQPGNIEWAINYLSNDASPCIQGKGGESTMLQVYGALKDRGISLDTAIDLVERFYNTFDKCDPLWNLGDGPLADRHDLKGKNAYNYLKKSAPGSASAEAEFTTESNKLDEETIARVEAMSQAAFAAAQQREQERAQAQADAESPDTYPEGVDAGDGAPDKIAMPKLADQLLPLSKIEPKEIGREATLCNEWVYCVGQERFVNRRRPILQLKTSQFDAKYNPIATNKPKRITSQLFGKQEPLKRFWSVAFVPGEGEVLPDGKYNVFRQSPLKPAAGDTDIWNEHLNYLFQNEDDRNAVLNWMAWIVQNPTLKPNHALLIIGRNTGTGKSFLARVLEQIIGVNNTQRPKNSSMGGDFNSWLLNCRLCIVEEVMQVNRRENLNAMRDLITETRVEVNMKNVPAFVVDNYVCMMGISNHDDALPIDESDRRWLIVETFASPRGSEYYDRLFPILKDEAALAAIYAELLARDLQGYTGFQRPPMTDAKRQMIELSRTDAESWLVENASKPPLSRNIVTLQDVLDAMPANVQRTPRVTTAVIPNFLRGRLMGTKLKNQRRVNGRPEYLWMLRNSILRIPDDQIVSRYESERKNDNAIMDDGAVEDFAVE